MTVAFPSIISIVVIFLNKERPDFDRGFLEGDVMPMDVLIAW